VGADRFEEAINYVKQANDLIYSVDGFLIKLDTAIEMVEEEDPKLVADFIEALRLRGLLDRLACHKKDLDSLVVKSRFPSVYKYIDILRAELEKAPCIEPFSVTVPKPSRQASQISWGKEFRDVRRERGLIKHRGRIVKMARVSPVWLLAISIMASTIIFYLIFRLVIG